MRARSSRSSHAIDAGADRAWALGAPAILLAGRREPDIVELARRAEGLAAGGQRVLLVAHVSRLGDDADELGVEPVALLLLEEQVRPDAASTVAWFTRQGVSLRVLSGDHPATVEAMARRVGIDRGAAGDGGRSVYGRVTPEQTRTIIEGLRAEGHVVAMIGDGVNDVLAMKSADLGIAMGSGSPMARAVARVVLLDDAFERLPLVVAEGRRVIANIERVANLFLTKTAYATVLAIGVALAGLAFPFYPRH